MLGWNKMVELQFEVKLDDKLYADFVSAMQDLSNEYHAELKEIKK